MARLLSESGFAGLEDSQDSCRTKNKFIGYKEFDVVEGKVNINVNQEGVHKNALSKEPLL